MVFVKKLDPLLFTTLAELRKNLYGGERLSIHLPVKKESCWAEVREARSSNYSPSFKQCEKAARNGHLTCLVHYDRELAARELKCEAQGLKMDDIAYADEVARQVHYEEDRAASRGAHRT